MNLLFSSVRSVLKGQSTAAATIQTLLTRVFILALNLATGVVTARLLGTEGRGEQAAIALWAILLSSSATLGLPTAVTYNLRRFAAQRSQIFAAAVLIGTAIGIGVGAVGAALMPRLLANQSGEVIVCAQWCMVYVPVNLLVLIGSAALEAEGMFTLPNQSRLFQPLLTLIALLLLAVTHQITPFTASLSYLCSNIPILAYMLFCLWRQFRPRLTDFGKTSKHLLSYGLPSYGIDVVFVLSTQMDQVIVVGLLPAHLVGIYAVATSLGRIMMVIQLPVVTVLFPKIAARPLEEVVTLTGQAARVCMVLMIVSCAVLAVIGTSLLKLLYGNEFEAAGGVFQVLLLESIFSGTAFILAQAFMALGKPGLVTITQAIGLALAIPLMYTLTPQFGLMGTVSALLISAIVRLGFILCSYSLFLKVKAPSLWMTAADWRFLKQNFLRL